MAKNKDFMYSIVVGRETYEVVLLEKLMRFEWDQDKFQENIKKT